MSDSSEEAKRLLPCNCPAAPAMSQFDNGHTLNCAVFFRPAVAAALAARDEEIAELKAALDSVSFPDRRWK